MRTLEFVLDLPGVSQHAIWEFHRDPAALETLSPPEKQVRVIENPTRVEPGARVRLRVRQFGIWLNWTSRYEAVEPESRFLDTQEAGPFAFWQHEHLFSPGRIVDRITYEPPLARWGGAVVDRILIQPDIERMFRYRHQVTRKALLHRS
jgi:ligand-binding SRPBCC domain-containing protein